MKKATKTAGQTAPKTSNTNKTNGSAPAVANQVNKAEAVEGAQVAPAPAPKVGKPTKAEALKEAGAIKTTQEAKADKKAKAEATRLAKQQASARKDRATKVVGRIKAEAATLSGVLRSVWVYATELEEATEVQKADSLTIRADFKAVTGEDWPSTRREFARLWLVAIKRYGKAVDTKGEAVTMASRAGYLWAVPFVPTLSAVWSDVVGGWAKKRTPWAVEANRYYKRNEKGEAVPALKTEAEKAIKEAEAIAKAVAEAKAKAGEKARQEWAGGKTEAKA